MTAFSFQITARDKKTKARTGVIHTAHGVVKTPAFVPVGTQATVKSLSSEDLKEIGVQLFFVNTYHMYLRPGLDVIKKFGGLHQFMNWPSPLISDSAGFQIFSLGGEAHRQRRMRMSGTEVEAPLVRINEEGVTFRSHLDGSEHVFTPEKSIEAQSILGADIMIAFDECTYFPATRQYARQAMERTHRWALRSLRSAQSKQREYQALYGVVQGGIYEDLRRASAQFIASLDFPGLAIGGVSVGESKKEMTDVLDWVVPLLPDEKPRHLLGVGEIDDIFALVERGIDSFDCVMPTRIARMGFVLAKLKTKNSKLKTYKGRYYIDINKAKYAEDKSPLDENCGCWVCHNYSRAYIHHLFRAKELLAYRLATFHNLCFMEEMMSQVRTAISRGRFKELKEEWLNH
jgi:tRNA-guanine transglycosylase